MRRLVFLVTVLALGLLLPVRAQTEIPLPETCDKATVKEILTVVKTAVDNTLTGLDTADPVQAAAVLEGVKSYIGFLKAVCDNLSFSGGEEKVLDPVLIPAGIYRVTLTTESYGIVHAAALDGKCGQGTGSFLSESLFNVTAGDAKTGAETTFRSEGCSALIEVANVQANWSLTFEKLN